ncbi:MULTISPECIES: DNA ligase [Hydrogenophaga]|uniref:DNA ligase n=1 Tax=Hydrogenophaga TaxID=47420 RepID=UPI00398C51D9
MRFSRRVLLRGLAAALLGTGLAPLAAWSADAPALMLANVYRPGVRLADYWLSEKYDGLRAFWDGERLRTRGGETIAAPDWFTAQWPAEPMDGELWAGRGRFEEAMSTVRQLTPDDAAWRRIRFMVFDLPAHPGVFTERIEAYGRLVRRIDQAWVQAVPQERVGSHAELMARLDRMVRDGGEGLMLHRGDAPYRAVRNDDLLKVKTHEDAEARVVGHVPGKGRHAGRMGALVVQTPQGLRFKLGTGFTDAERDQPPAVGTWVTYRFRGLNESGVPRFASFVRVRPDAPR